MRTRFPLVADLPPHARLSLNSSGPPVIALVAGDVSEVVEKCRRRPAVAYFSEQREALLIQRPRCRSPHRSRPERRDCSGGPDPGPVVELPPDREAFLVEGPRPGVFTLLSGQRPRPLQGLSLGYEALLLRVHRFREAECLGIPLLASE